MAEAKANTAVLEPPEEGRERPSRRLSLEEAEQLKAKEQLLQDAEAGSRFPQNIPVLVRGKIIAPALSALKKLLSLLKPTGPMLWVLFVLASLLVFFGSLQLAGVFNPGEIVQTTKLTVKKVNIKDAVASKAKRAVSIAKGGFSTAGGGLSQLKKIPVFFSSSYSGYKAWKKERQKDRLVLQQKNLHFEQKKIAQAQKGLEKQSANLKEQEDKINARKITLLQEEQRLAQFKEELKKREKALLKKQQQKPQEKVKAKGAAKGESAEKAEPEKLNLENIVRLSDIYKNMPPDQAAEVVKEMDDELVIAIFMQMKERTVARIMGEMEPQKAAALSKKMSGK